MPKQDPTPEAPSVTSGDAVTLPTPAPVNHAAPLGVGNVRRSEPELPAGTRTARPRAAGAASDLFPAGGEAFERWLASEKGIDPRTRLPTDQYDAFLAEFASRPIHGHRRGTSGGNHRPNRADLR